MTNFYSDQNYSKGPWSGWCTNDDTHFLFGLVIDRKELWLRILMNTGNIRWVEANETIKIDVG